ETNPDPDWSACNSPYTPDHSPNVLDLEQLNPELYKPDTPGYRFFDAFKYFDNIFIAGLPGGQRELLIFNKTQYLSAPGNNTLPQNLWQARSDQYHGRHHWLVSCAPTQRHAWMTDAFGNATALKAMWVAKSPDGLTYYFDEPARGSHWLAPWQGADDAVFGKMRIYVSKIVDRNGNWLEFEY